MPANDLVSLKDAFGPGIALLVLILVMFGPTLLQRIGKDKQTNLPPDHSEDIKAHSRAIADLDKRVSRIERRQETDDAVAKALERRDRTHPPTRP